MLALELFAVAKLVGVMLSWRQNHSQHLLKDLCLSLNLDLKANCSCALLETRNSEIDSSKYSLIGNYRQEDSSTHNSSRMRLIF